MNGNTRVPSIDTFRAIGLLLVILAHCGPPRTILEIRSFDVPLMVFVSALTFSGNTNKSYVNYCINRTFRLVIPVWLFASFYLLWLFGLNKVMGSTVYFSSSMILPTYMLWNDGGIGYLWIIRVFLLVMLLTPLLYKIVVRINNRYLFVVLIGVLMLCHNLFATWVMALNKTTIRFILEEYGIYLTGFSIIMLVGLKIKQCTQKDRLYYLIIAIFVILLSLTYYVCENGVPIFISRYKYPPHSYYILYGISICSILWLFRNNFKKYSNNKIMLFIGQNTMWIYLWHIFVLPLIVHLHLQWYLTYIGVIVSSLIIYYAQLYIIRYLPNGIKKYLKG